MMNHKTPHSVQNYHPFSFFPLQEKRGREKEEK